eukprot:m.36775 g.36775  ORF g.36775 m.36775 type:complete len:219 (-) comp17449_c0_seq1:49-705(-)
MGSSESRLSVVQLEEYEYCTFFNRKEILLIEKRWQQLLKTNDEYARDFDDPSQKEGWSYDDRFLSAEEMMAMPELQYNPFKTQVVKVFSSQFDGSIGFDDFLDMLSVFSEKAEKHVKASFAFKIYDWDGDGWLSKDDLIATVKALCDHDADLDEHTEKDVTTNKREDNTNLDSAIVNEIVDKIINESDLDGDEKLSFVEFDNIIARSPDFVNTFRIRM